MNAYEKVTNARSASRPLGAYYIKELLTDFMELHGDRRFGDDAAIVGGIGLFEGQPVTAVAMERGNTIEERMTRKFGCPGPEGYRKALRLMKQAEKFHRPILCIINSSGAYCGMDAEERGQGQAIAENLMEMMALKVPVLAIIAGEGGSGGALALSVANKIIMLENAVYSVISPEGCASILWKDAKFAPEASEALKLTAEDLLRFGVADCVIREQGRTQEQITQELKNVIRTYLAELAQLSDEALAQTRQEKFRAIGA